MFAPIEGFSDQMSLETLYKKQLRPQFQELSSLKEEAQKRKTAYIVSSVLAVLLILTFVYFYKLTGLIVAIIMIVAGYFTLKSSEPVIGSYQAAYKSKIISPITKLVAGYHLSNGSISKKQFLQSGLFAAPIKQFASWDLYEKEGVQFSYLHVVFDTKENASLEKMAKNTFDGYLIMIDKKNAQTGVLVSASLRDSVADMDMKMASFFAKEKRAGSVNGFDMYGEVNQVNRDKVSQVNNNKIAFSYQKDKTYIALYKKNNPFSVDVFNSFDLLKAQRYAKSIKEIESLVTFVK